MFYTFNLLNVYLCFGCFNSFNVQRIPRYLTATLQSYAVLSSSHHDCQSWPCDADLLVMSRPPQDPRSASDSCHDLARNLHHKRSRCQHMTWQFIIHVIVCTCYMSATEKFPWLVSKTAACDMKILHQSPLVINRSADSPAVTWKMAIKQVSICVSVIPHSHHTSDTVVTPSPPYNTVCILVVRWD